MNNKHYFKIIKDDYDEYQIIISDNNHYTNSYTIYGYFNILEDISIKDILKKLNECNRINTGNLVIRFNTYDDAVKFLDWIESLIVLKKLNI